MELTRGVWKGLKLEQLVLSGNPLAEWWVLTGETLRVGGFVLCSDHGAMYDAVV